MIKSLQKKFILINMLLVLIVLCVVFSALCVTNYRQAVSSNLMTLQMSLDRRDSDHPPKFEVGKRPPDDFVRSPVIVLRLTEDGVSVISEENISISEEKAVAVAEAVMQSGRSEGVLGEYNLRFKLRGEPGGTKIALIDMYSETAALSGSLLTSAIAMVGSLAAFFVVSLFLSRWALRPAEKAWRQQRQFVADASHELKTPLTVILANTGILKANRSETIESEIKWVENTEMEAGRMRQLVDSLLFLAKADEADAPQHTPVNLSDAVFNVALTLEALAYERAVTIDTSRVEQGIFIMGDEAQLLRLITVLADNAVKYSEPSGVVTIALEAKQQRALLSVRNMGNPLSHNELEHIFERFYRVDKSRSREGYGLGLAIAKSVAEVHQGKLSVQSSAAAGTVFTAAFPMSGNTGGREHHG